MKSTSSFLGIFVMLIFTVTVSAETAEDSKTTKKFPQKYSGDDITAVVSKMKKINKRMGNKSEFETSAEYKARVDEFADKTKENDIYIVIKPQNITSGFDADSKVLGLQIATGLRTDRGFVLNNNEKKTGSFKASNRLGANITVTKFRRNIVKFIPNTVTCSEKLFGSGSTPSQNNLQLSVDSETAKRLKNSIAVLYTANPARPYYKHDNERIPLYGIENAYAPIDIDSTEDVIYADIKKITLFIYNTGEIYREYDLGDFNCKSKQNGYSTNSTDEFFHSR